MKALIYNSGIGKRMGELTAHCPKSMVHLYNDETIFERQIRLLQEAGIFDVVITTGPYPEMLKEVCSKSCFKNMHFTFVHNEKYDQTNYIYSLYKARDEIDDDFITLHGDLVFDRDVIPAILKDKRKNLILINKSKPLPPKDFKGRLIDDKLVEVGVNIFDSNCYALQPIYKMDKATFKAWVNKVEEYVKDNNVNVYAENALNVIAKDLNILPFSYARHFVDEVDNADDLARVNACIEQFDFKKQKTFVTSRHIAKVKSLLKDISVFRPLIVADSYFTKAMNKEFKDYPVFSNFTPNPKYEEVLEGIKLYEENKCDSIISIGGGSCIDVAKTIKLCLNADKSSDVPLHKQAYKHVACRHICLPTTSGTGSEATRHAVIYYKGEKQSICNSALLPEYVVLSYNLVISAPRYQKMCTCLDALSQCMESSWSKKATKVSKRYAKEGIELFKKCYKSYIANEPSGVKDMQLVANLSGKAINISETTAGHALSYKITSMYGVPHGHAVAICLNAIFNNVEFKYPHEYKELYDEVIKHFAIDVHIKDEHKKENIKLLCEAVNPIRLANFPKKLSNRKIKEIYNYILQ